MNNKLVKAAMAVSNETTTTNGMKAYKSTLNDLVDLFYKGPSLRNNVKDVHDLVINACHQNPEAALRILFYIRDIRGGCIGQGERAVFREGLLAFFMTMGIDDYRNKAIIEHIPEYGRWDDLLYFIGYSDQLNKYILETIKIQVHKDVAAMRAKEYNKISLLAKWLPSASAGRKKTVDGKKRVRTKAYNDKQDFIKMFCKYCNITEKQYRKTLSALRKNLNLLETNLTNKDYTFDYSKLPSKARFKHSKNTGVFIRKDEKRYTKFVEDLTSGKVKANVGTIYPYELVKRIMNEVRMSYTPKPSLVVNQINSDWKNLPNWLAKTNARFLPVIDTSGSMLFEGVSYKALHVALGIGLYMAERNVGTFHKAFITFSEKPEMRVLKGDKLSEYISGLREINCMNTDFYRVFQLILKSAIKFNVPQEEMPTHILTISDMQFDSASNGDLSKNVLELVKEEYAKYGYEAPHLVFWNAGVNTPNVPVTYDDNGVTLVAGCKPGLLEQIVESNTPEEMVNNIINHPRYSVITY